MNEGMRDDAEPKSPPTGRPFDELPAEAPTKRIRLETEPSEWVGRLADLFFPIGLGQRALIAAPPRAGATTVLGALAAAIARNRPDVATTLLSIGGLPAEAADVRGCEIVSAGADMSADERVALAESVLARAKRTVEGGGHTVVVLDSLTTLSRAYHDANPTARQLAGPDGRGAIVADAVRRAQQFFGAARAIVCGGSLTMIASLVVDAGTGPEDAIAGEFRGTGNATIILDRRMAERGMFPAIDLVTSHTRRPEALIPAEDILRIAILRHALADTDPLEAAERFRERLEKTATNADLLAGMNLA